MSINSYGKWEQAFRIFSNILTAKYPGKAGELYQDNHIIHMASMSNAWDNVYAYDKEFRYHISRHPSRSWGVILQQAWTMLIKDRIKTESFENKGLHNVKIAEWCRRYNRGNCTYGLSCRYEHRCAVKRCRKFGHGAHICRLRTGGDRRSEDSADREERKNFGGHHGHSGGKSSHKKR